MKTFDAEVTRDDRFWLIRVSPLDRSTQAVRYKDVAVMANELIQIMTGLAEHEYRLRINVRLPESVQDHRTRAEVLRAEARHKTAEAAAEHRAAAQELIALGLSQREAGEVLGLSFQRVNQLVNP
ncbi:MAG TPA: hypothetical protein VFV67_35715 [Actinophytocola sp.]|uniref:hypothetical protein n=1 Tax=Actinophytocola sp. TaxID=1872138 RepID=UPI002DBD3B9D|nr:hypothetical protein [Actinophytocola sp.]HEU5476004.1 hypothetical protein [Actinophytocola sp.]